jgi:hypothetical protein
MTGKEIRGDETEIRTMKSATCLPDRQAQQAIIRVNVAGIQKNYQLISKVY